MDRNLICSLLSIISFIYAKEVKYDGNMKINDTFSTGQCKIVSQEGDLVTWMSYGYLQNGMLFDVGEYEIKIGNKEAPEGIDQGLRGLCVGDERKLTIQPDLAYGEHGLDNRVPASSIVIYDMKILSIERNIRERKGILMNKFLKFSDLNEVENCEMKVQGGDTISWHYIGTLTNGTGFDTGDFRATIDKGQVIKGVNEAMKGLCVGGKRRMVMHHSYAYGPQGRNKIPPYANLLFDVHLKSIDRPNVGWEDFEAKLRTFPVISEENPVHVTDINKTGQCDVKTSVGDFVTYQRIGYLLSGKIFEDRIVEREIKETGTPLEKALLGLCVADNRSVILHSTLAFGTKGLRNAVPINATVIYDVSLVDFAKHSTRDTKDEGIEKDTGLKPNQKVRIEILEKIENCTLRSQEGDTISWKYRGTFLDGSEFYKGTFKAMLGRNQVILGVDRGMRNMCVGEKRRLTVHSDWAYGDEGRPPAIPPKSTLVFENILTRIERRDEL